MQAQISLSKCVPCVYAFIPCVFAVRHLVYQLCRRVRMYVSEYYLHDAQKRLEMVLAQQRRLGQFETGDQSNWQQEQQR